MRGELASPELVGFATSQFQTIEKIGLQQHGKEHLPQPFRIPGQLNGRAQQVDVFGKLLLGRFAHQYAIELFLHRSHHFLVRRGLCLEDDFLESLGRDFGIPAVLATQAFEQFLFLRSLQAGGQNLFARYPFGVSQHHQQMSAVQGRDVIITNPRTIG